jgi:hypothetical protein
MVFSKVIGLAAMMAVDWEFVGVALTATSLVASLAKFSAAQ